MIDRQPDNPPPNRDEQPQHASSPESAPDLSEVETGYMLAALRLVDGLKNNFRDRGEAQNYLSTLLSTVGKEPEPGQGRIEREHVLYALVWMIDDASQDLLSGSDDLLLLADLGTQVMERFSDQPLLGAPIHCDPLADRIITLIDSLYDEIRTDPGQYPEYARIVEQLSGALSPGSIFGRTPTNISHPGPYDTIRQDLQTMVAQRLSDALNFDVVRRFPESYSVDEIELITVVIALANRTGLCDQREILHSLFVKTYDWYLEHVPEVAEMGGCPLPGSEKDEQSYSYRDSDDDDGDAEWRSSLKSDEEIEEELKAKPQAEAPELDPDLDSPPMLTADVNGIRSARLTAMENLFCSLTEGFTVAMSSHVNDESSVATRECLAAIVEDLSPAWFGWTPVLTAYSSLSIYCLEATREPIREKLINPILQGKTQLARDLLHFIDAGRDQLEVCASVVRELSAEKRRRVISVIREECEYLEQTLNLVPDRAANSLPTITAAKRLEAALKRPGNQYLGK